MSAKTDALLRGLQHLDQILSTADVVGLTAEEVAEKRAERDTLARQLAEANAALAGKQLLKG